VKLEREMGLVEHRQHPTCGTHQSRSHGCAQRNGIDEEFQQLGLGFEFGTKRNERSERVAEAIETGFGFGLFWE